MYVQIGAKIKQAREEMFLSQAELGSRLSITATAINYYEKGKRKINVEDLYRLAAVLHKPVGFFLPGEEVHAGVGRERLSGCLDDLIGLPVVGAVRAGEPALTEQHVLGYLPYPRKMAGPAHFALKVKGDSMTGQGICDGDLVLIRRQNHVDFNGQIVCALVNGVENTLKIFLKDEGRILLRAANQAYPDLVLKSEGDLDIQGVLMGVFKFPAEPEKKL